ncbi:MAG: lactate utilization protein [Bacteroidales bacterium]|nr:lactate utilization protein [Bacteroidales bacterium]
MHEAMDRRAGPKQLIYQKQAEQIIRNLNHRKIAGRYFDTASEAVEEICRMIPPGAVVGLGGSETVIETGLLEALRKLDINLLDRYRKDVTEQEVEEMRESGFTSDLFITSTNAITLDGILVNQDGQGNRVACLIYGPKKVIVITGMNKVTENLEQAISRIKTIAAPMNALRRNKLTPCSKTGVCHDAGCFPPNRICNQLVITEGSRTRDRITVLLIGSEYGF